MLSTLANTGRSSKMRKKLTDARALSVALGVGRIKRIVLPLPTLRMTSRLIFSSSTHSSGLANACASFFLSTFFIHFHLLVTTGGFEPPMGKLYDEDEIVFFPLSERTCDASHIPWPCDCVYSHERATAGLPKSNTMKNTLWHVRESNPEAKVELAAYDIANLSCRVRVRCHNVAREINSY